MPKVPFRDLPGAVQSTLRRQLQEELIKELEKAIKENPPDPNLEGISVVIPEGVDVKTSGRPAMCGTCGTCATCATCSTCNTCITCSGV